MNVQDSELDRVGKVAEAFLDRYRRGEHPTLTEYIERYPELAEQIRDLFPALMVVEELGGAAGPPSRSPVRAAQGKVPEYLGDYRIVRELGRGGMGVVYEAVQESLGRHVALKVLSYHSLLPPTYLERFRREARAAAGLHHTNIVPVYGVGEHEGVHYYAMQFIRGQALDEVLKEVRRLRRPQDPVSPPKPRPGADLSRSLAEGLIHGHFAPADASASRTDALAGAAVPRSAPGRVPPDPPAVSTMAGSANATQLTTQSDAQYFRSVARMGLQVALALDYAHKQGILHRDIKPSNLLLDARGVVWITDFGLAKAEGGDALTRTGDIVGTLRYMAPERFQGGSDQRSDVYGLGITLYEMLTLRPAFEKSGSAPLLQGVAHEEPPAPRKVDRSIPRDLETIVLKAIAKEPGRRYQSAADLAEDLARFLVGEPVRARRIGLWERAVKWARRRPALAALLAVSAAAALALLLVMLVHNTRLGAALADSEANLEKARTAERAMTEQLAIAELREAQARRHSGLVGQRYGSLEAIKSATSHFRALGQLDESRALELRNEAIACLLLPDPKPGKERPPDPGWTRPTAFDPTLQLYVVRSIAEDQPVTQAPGAGDLSIRRAADDREVARLPGFGVRAVSNLFSPDGRYLAVHYEWGQRYVYVWDVGRREAILKVSLGGYESFPVFSPDSRFMALAQPDHSIHVYDLASRKVTKVLPPGLPVQAIQFHPDGRRLAVVTDKTVRLRDVDGKELATFQHPGRVHALAWRGDGRVFATGCYDHDIYLWDVANPTQPLRTLKGHLGSVFYVGFSRSGELLASDSWDSTCRLWDPMTGQQLLSMRGGSSTEFGPDGQALNYAWQQAGGQACRTFHGGKALNDVALSPRGRLVASVCAEGVELWDGAAEFEGDKHLATLPLGSAMTVRFSPDGDSLITDSIRAGLQRWPIAPDPRTGGLRIGPPESLGLSARAPLVGNNPDFALTADGRTVAYCPTFGHALLYQLDDPRRKVAIESPRLRHVAFSPDGRWLATGNWQGKGARVWNAQTGRPVQPLDLLEADQGAAWPVFSPDGKWLVIGTFGEYRFWEVGSWQRKHGLRRAPGSRTIGRGVFAPDGKVMAALHGVRGVQLVDPATGREYARLPNAGCPCCFSRDGGQLLTHGNSEGAFQVWDLRLIRGQLKDLDLDWDLPPYPPPSQEAAGSLRIEVVAARPLLPSADLEAQAVVERAEVYLQMRDYPRATGDFNRAAELAPQGMVWETAVAASSRLIEQYPQDEEAVHFRAHAQLGLGQPEKAVEDLSRAINLAQQRPDLLACRGKAYLRAGQRDRAAEDLRNAGARDAEVANRVAWELATSARPSLREPALAVGLAQQAVRRSPGEGNYWNTLGVAHYRAGEWEAAARALEESEKLAPGKYLGFNAFVLAMCHHQLHDAARAGEQYDRAVRWSEERQDKLSETHRRDLKAFRTEAEALLKPPPSAP